MRRQLLLRGNPSRSTLRPATRSPHAARPRRSMDAIMHRWRSAAFGAKLFSVQVSAGDQYPNGFQT